ncbi:MAG TPA: diaminopimelate epimerase [Candidatus Limiplasma sp.]|nr:diaminopimelate epimerase [Candidatus Limiplasma sp.]
MDKNFVAKYHGLGNDYIVIDPAYVSAEMTPETIRLICDRHFGVGSDGILYGPLTAREPYQVRIFNPDGSEAEKSGNGIRIFSKYLADAGYLGGKTSFYVLTAGGVAHVALLDPQAELIEADMGKPSFQSPEIPVAGEAREVVDEEIDLAGAPYRITCVTVGNPHGVIVMDTVSEELARTLGPLVENHPRFPNRINMQLVQVLNRNEIRIEIWERGAGYTLASGSSSCAAAAAAHRLGLVDDRITVRMPGGTLLIRIQPDGRLLMRGPVVSVYEGRLTPAFLRALERCNQPAEKL